MTTPAWRKALEPQDAPSGPSQQVYGSPVPCQVCGQPAWTQTPRQTTRGEHPACRGSITRLTDQAMSSVTFSTARTLGAKVIG